jgi:hypothetical protein
MTIWYDEGKPTTPGLYLVLMSYGDTAELGLRAFTGQRWQGQGPTPIQWSPISCPVGYGPATKGDPFALRAME